MLFQSNLLGQVNVDENSVLTFPLGLPGFEDCVRFKLFHEEENGAPRVLWMQSLEEADVLFSVVDAAEFGVRYEIELADDEVEALQLAKPEDAVVLVMVYRAEDAVDASHPLLKSLNANLRSPLVVNPLTQRGIQIGQLNVDAVLSR